MEYSYTKHLLNTPSLVRLGLFQQAKFRFRRKQNFLREPRKVPRHLFLAVNVSFIWIVDSRGSKGLECMCYVTVTPGEDRQQVSVCMIAVQVLAQLLDKRRTFLLVAETEVPYKTKKTFELLLLTNHDAAQQPTLLQAM